MDTSVLTDLDWRHPQYAPIFQQRAARLARLRAEPERLPFVRRHYRDHPADFINDWGVTSEPRNVEIGLPVNLPFLLFPRQREWIEWVLRQWRARESGVTVKSRDMGISWLAMALSGTLCLFNDDLAIGVGSRKLELVDNGGDPKSLFWKVRTFLQYVPSEFKAGFNPRTACKEGLIIFPNGSTIAGEGGDEIGRGGRAGLYWVDETAKLAHPDLVDAALSQTTNCRMDISTPNGSANSFARRVHEWPEHRVFRYHWRDDPRKDDAWYEKQKHDLDPVILAQEVDMDFSASVRGVLIPSAWVQSAIDIHKFLGIEPSGRREGALDVADEGRDMNAYAANYGIVLERVDEWSGKGDDIYGTVQWAFGLADELGHDGFRYDADGLGAGVRGDARVINERRAEEGAQAGSILRPLIITPFRGSGAVLSPKMQDVPGRQNKDFFENLKAQSWWTLRRRFEQTHRARLGEDYDPDMLISIPSDMPLRSKLVVELSQPTFGLNNKGKVVVNKMPDDARSPNLADAVMMLMGRYRRVMQISEEAMRAA